MILDFNTIFDAQYRNSNSGNLLEKAIARKFELEFLRSGGHVIRNEKGWRENEKQIEYIWFTYISAFSKGFLGVISIKFNALEFRGIRNDEELVQGIFTFDANGNISAFHSETNKADFSDPVRELNNFNLFDDDKSITLDGVLYNFNIRFSNINAAITLNNPKSIFWRDWENKLWGIGKRLATNSNHPDLKKFFV